MKLVDIKFKPDNGIISLQNSSSRCGINHHRSHGNKIFELNQAGLIPGPLSTAEYH